MYMLEPTPKTYFLVTHSKHYHFSEKYGIAWQKKELDQHSSRMPVVIYVLTNGHRTYFELSPDYLESYAVDFLARSFHQKNGQRIGLVELKNQLEGVPDAIVVPRKLLQQFPVVGDYLDSKRIVLSFPKSGFDMGPALTAVQNIHSEIDASLIVQMSLLTNTERSKLFSDEDQRIFISTVMSENLNNRHAIFALF